jgi:ABC-type transport system involved in multi-copper enzyme maturation permease subunit
MIRLIIEKELRDIIGSTKFAVTFGACAVLLLLAFYIGGRNYLVAVEEFEAGKKESLGKLEGITDWNEVRSNRIFLPPEPVASLVMGVSNDIGRNTEVRGRGELTAEDSRYGDDPIYAVFRFLDLDFVFQIVLSLFAILFAYDAINGEKEQGTLRLTFANPVPRAEYIIGKMAGSFLALGVPLLVPILIGALILLVLGVPMQAPDWLRLALVIVTGYLYFGAFLAITLFVSARTERSSSSFLISLVIWILAVMVIPRTAVLIAGRAVDVPSVDELNSQKSRYAASLWQEDRKKMSEFRPPEGTAPDKVMTEFQKFMSGIGTERDKKMTEFADRLNEDRSNKQRVQERLAFGLAMISPSATFSLAAMAIGGTGIHLQEQYKRSAEQYQGSFAEFIKEKTGTTPSGGIVFRISTDNDQPKKQPINPMELPGYQFRQESLSASLGSLAVDFGALILFNVVFFVGAFVSFLKYDVR